jgi:hypothetical protein
MALSKVGSVPTQKEGYTILQIFELRKLEGIFSQKGHVSSALEARREQ